MRTKYRVDDVVSFILVSTRMEGVVVEDRGPLGINSQWVYDILVPFESSDSMHFELQVGDFELVRRAGSLALA